MRMQVWFLGLLSGLRICCCCELWCRSVATALILPLAWEPPYSEGTVLKKQNKTKQNTSKEGETITFLWILSLVNQKPLWKGKAITARILPVNLINSELYFYHFLYILAQNVLPPSPPPLCFSMHHLVISIPRQPDKGLNWAANNNNNKNPGCSSESTESQPPDHQATLNKCFF